MNMITKLERIDDEPEELRFTEAQLPRAFPPRVWKEREARGALPELDEEQTQHIDEMSPENQAEEALRWHQMKPRERATWLEDSLLSRTAARMASLHAKGLHLPLLESEHQDSNDDTCSEAF
jgi:hypothetical protein